MAKSSITITARQLTLPLKTTVRHASASRKKGESIWVQAHSDNYDGYGEGCPRDYVAGDEINSSIEWIHQEFGKKGLDIDNINKLTDWVHANSHKIDSYPSAWCAVEMAALDLFGKKENRSVEALLNVKTDNKYSHYTAVLGNDQTWKFKGQADLYLIKGLTDFKVKLSGDIKKDQKKINIIQRLANEHNTNIRLRLDANNLWKDDIDGAIAFVKALKGNFFAIEEPLRAGFFKGLSCFSQKTGLPVILDESLCTQKDLDQLQNLPGQFIANVKISRVGGLIRAKQLIQRLKAMNWKIIIGCHVGETSLLTRCGLIASAMAGTNLIAHEGAFGEYLLEREPAFPTLTFRQDGVLNLESPYHMKTVKGLNRIEPETWNTGLGLTCRMPTTMQDGSPQIKKFTMKDGYPIHYRVWGETKEIRNEKVLLILHGGMSHSGWQAPLAKALIKKDNTITIIASDRRGCGLNPNRGDLGTRHLVIEDVIQQITHLQHTYKQVHLAGWCQGAQFAAIAASQLTTKPNSLILITPGFFWNERFRSVLSISENVILDLISEFKLKPERDHACIPVPMAPEDFTLNDVWLDFIDNDPLKTTKLSLKSTNIMDEIQERSWYSIIRNTLPTLAILAKKDRIVDNQKIKQFIGYQFLDNNLTRIETIDAGHAIQFEKPCELSERIVKFINAI